MVAGNVKHQGRSLWENRLGGKRGPAAGCTVKSQR